MQVSTAPRRFRNACLAWMLAVMSPWPIGPVVAQTADAMTAASPPAPLPLTGEQAQRELRILKRALSDLHPGLYRYQTPEQFEATFAQAQAEVAGGSDAMRMYLIASRIAAAVRCGHTWTNTINQGPAMQQALAALPALPLRVKLLEDRLWVTASADPNVPSNVELLSIDGRTPAALIDEFLPYLRADGGNDGKRRSQLDSDANGGAMDRLLPLLHPPGADGYTVEFRSDGDKTRTAVVRGIAVTERERLLTTAGQTPESEEWRFSIEGDIATLRLPTFALWNSDFDWRAFLQKSFDTLAEKRVPHLIIDLRENEGGDDTIGRALMAHLLTKPHTIPTSRGETAYERVPYDLARFLDTWDFSFFDRTGQVVRGEQRNWSLREQPQDIVVTPVARPYRGKVVLLTGPRMSSATFLLARNIKASGIGTLIGRETGGSLRGLNGGQLAWLTLPVSGVSIDIPLISSVAETSQPDRGVAPDIAVRTRIEDLARGIDPDREAALRWFNRSR
jgi:Peptidase family S41